MARLPGLPGGGVDPLFSVVFVGGVSRQPGDVRLRGPADADGGRAALRGVHAASCCGSRGRGWWQAVSARADLEAFKALQRRQNRSTAGRSRETSLETKNS